MNDTPRIDAALQEINGSFWVPKHAAENLERELLAKNQVIKNIEYTIKEVRAEWGALKQQLDSSRNYTQFLFDNAAKEQEAKSIWKMRAVALQDLIRTAVAALNDYPMSQDAQMGLLVSLAKAIDDPILEHVRPSAPPVDNAHVAEGCEKFGEDVQLPASCTTGEMKRRNLLAKIEELEKMYHATYGHLSEAMEIIFGLMARWSVSRNDNDGYDRVKVRVGQLQADISLERKV